MSRYKSGPRHQFQVWDSHLPPEFYGRSRDDVSLLVIENASGTYSSARFAELPEFLKRGDILVFNDSALVPSSLPVFDVSRRQQGWLNVGTSRLNGKILVEPRPKSFNRMQTEEGNVLAVIGNGREIELSRRHSTFSRFFWADARMGEDELRETLGRYGAPLTYDHIPFKLPLSFYSTVVSRVPGSAEFPSASRPFSRRVMASLRQKGILQAYLTLHCNLSPLEPDEFSSSPFLPDEYYEIPEATATAAEEARDSGGRVIAVGTSVVRALESSYRGRIVPGSGTTDLFIRPGRRPKSVDGLLTGLHDPESSHVEMISAFLDDSLLRSAYTTASAIGFQWHEFGDLSLIA